MVKTLVLIAIILVLGFLVVWGLMALLKQAERLEDEDYQERVATARELREASDDFRYDREQAKRFDDLNTPESKKRTKK